MRLPSLPAGWRYAPLKRVAALRFSSVDKHTLPEETPVRLCNYLDVYRNEQITRRLDFMEATASRSEIGRFSLLPGDVLLTKDSEEPSDIGVPACVAEHLDGVICGYHLALARPRPDVLDGPFLQRSLQATGIRDQFHSRAVGVTRFALGLSEVGDALIPVAPLPLQHRITALLGRKTAAIDQLIQKKERLIELLQEKRQALITQAVTKGLDPGVPMKGSGVAWIGAIPAHWMVRRLKGVCRLETGHTPAKSEAAYWIPEECTIPWVSLNDTKTLEANDHISETEAKISPLGMANSSAHLIPAGAVVFNRDGARVGLSAITTTPMAVSQHIIAWVCGPAVTNDYLLLVLYAMRDELYRLTAGATIPTIGMADVKELTTPVPPLVEQRAIVGQVNRVRRILTEAESRLEQSIELLREYRQALISAAVTGQIDVTREAS